jgi:hypothetical protein
MERTNTVNRRPFAQWLGNCETALKSRNPARRSTLLVGILFACGHEVSAREASDQLSTPSDESPLVSDRPDFTESTETIPVGRLQLELGYTFTYDSEDGQRRRDHSAPELLLRIGLFECAELRLGWDGYSWFDEKTSERTDAGRYRHHEESTAASNDVSLGVKVKLAEQAGWRPHFGIIAAVTVPTGSTSLTSSDVDPELVVAWAYDLTEQLTIAGNLGVGWPTEESERFVQSFGSVALGVGLTDRIGMYTEYFGIFPNADRTDCAHSFNAGFTYLLHEDLQFDIRAGFGLNEEADDFFSGVGLVWRF